MKYRPVDNQIQGSSRKYLFSRVSVEVSMISCKGNNNHIDMPNVKQRKREADQ